jgi:tetratricopeptide (TPR) repeat protein
MKREIRCAGMRFNRRFSKRAGDPYEDLCRPKDGSAFKAAQLAVWPGSCHHAAMVGRARYCAILLLACATAGPMGITHSAVAGPTVPAPTSGPDIQSLIENLSNPDPMERGRATVRLQKLGSAARQELIEAQDSPDPDIRLRAAEILARVPITHEGDSAQVQQLLERFRIASPTERLALMAELSRKPDDFAGIVICRILTDAASENDRWTAVDAIRYRRDLNFQKMLRELDTTGNNIPLLVAVGNAWYGRDTNKTRTLMRRATDLAIEHGKARNEHIQSAFEFLIADAISGGQYDQAAHLLRQQATTWDNGVALGGVEPSPVIQLLGLQATGGPLPGLTGDLALLPAAQWTDSIPLYCAAGFVRRMGHPLPAELLAWATFYLNNQSAPEHLKIGQFLIEHDWDRWARREFVAAAEPMALVSSPPVPPAIAGDDPANFTQIDAFVRLGFLAVDHDDPTTAIDQFEQAIKGFEKQESVGYLVQTNREGGLRPITVETLRIEVDLQRLRLARRKGDKKEIGVLLDSLLQQQIDDMDTVAEVVAVLRNVGRKNEASTLFQQAYSQNNRRLAMDPDFPEYLNNVAWLCAYSGERPAEAVELAEKAIAIDKDNAAFLDTAAEAHMRNGDYDRAVKLEKRAIELRPGNPFMQKQLKKFQNAAKIAGNGR